MSSPAPSQHYIASSGVVSLDAVPAKHRFTRNDIPKLPEALRKILSPSELERLFGEDGFLHPKVQQQLDSSPTLVDHPCRTCQSPAKNKCARCKMLYYCSKACQRSHWPAHKPTCTILTNPASANKDESQNAIQGNAEYTLTTQLQSDMRTHGRNYTSLGALLSAWFAVCPHGGNLSTQTQSSKHLFTLSRNSQGRLEIIQEYRSKIHRLMRARDRINVPASAQENIEEYIIKSVQANTRAENSPVSCIYGEFYVKPVIEIEFNTPEPQAVRRGGQILFIGGSWMVLQFNPDLLRQADEHHDGGALYNCVYNW